MQVKELVHTPEGENKLKKPMYVLVPYAVSLYRVMATQLETENFEQYPTWEEAAEAAQHKAGRHDIYKIYHEGHVTTSAT